MATKTKKKSASKKKVTRRKVSSKGSGIVTKISAHAKKIRKSGEAWTSTIKRASRELKAAGKI